jgi:preprotein translocase subunit SecE
MDKVKLILSRIRQFLEEARAELKKVTWPTRKQTFASTGVVLIVVIFLSLFLGLVDFGLAKIIKVLLG